MLFPCVPMRQSKQCGRLMSFAQAQFDNGSGADVAHKKFALHGPNFAWSNNRFLQEKIGDCFRCGSKQRHCDNCTFNNINNISISVRNVRVTSSLLWDSYTWPPAHRASALPSKRLSRLVNLNHICGLSQLRGWSGNNCDYQEKHNNQKGAEDLCRRTNRIWAFSSNGSADM